MKTMTKRIASVALAAIMALTVLVSALPAKAFATGENATLTVTSTDAAFSGKEVKIWKMFDMTVAGSVDQKSYGYTIDAEWKQFFIEKSTEFSLGLTSSSTDEEVSEAAYNYIYDLNTQGGDKVTEFAKAARDWAAEKSRAADDTQRASDTDPYTATFNNLDYGYYVVSPQAGSTDATRKTDAMLKPVTEATNTIALKSKYPTVEKTVDGNDKVNAEIGKKLTFKLTADVPDVSEYNAYQFTFKDTLSKGLTFGEFTKVTIDGQKLTADTEYKAEAGKPDQGTKATSISVKFGTQSGAICDAKNLFTGKAGKKIVVEYTAYINADAIVGQAIPNKATVDYSTSPDGAQTGTSNPDVTHQYTFGFQLKKTDDSNTPLAGAVFQLRHEETGDAIDLVKVEEGVYRLKLDGDSSSVNEVTTGANGIIKFQGLAAGTYYLVETKAPEGYNKLAKPIEITIADTTVDGAAPSWTVAMNKGQGVAGSEGNLPEIEVQNNKGFLLPETGGMGTVIFTVAGVAIIAGAIAWKRSRRAGNDA